MVHRPSPRKWSRHYPRGSRRHSPSFTVDEALGLIVSYEALLRYLVHPFSSEGISAVTKMRVGLPKV